MSVANAYDFGEGKEKRERRKTAVLLPHDIVKRGPVGMKQVCELS